MGPSYHFSDNQYKLCFNKFPEGLTNAIKCCCLVVNSHCHHVMARTAALASQSAGRPQHICYVKPKIENGDLMGPNGDLMGTQKLKKVPMGTRVSKWGPMWEQWTCMRNVMGSFQHTLFKHLFLGAVQPAVQGSHPLTRCPLP